MKFTKSNLLTAAVFFVVNVLNAQCQFNLNVSVRHSSCIGNGVVKVSLEGSEIDVSRLNITLAGNSIMETSNTNDIEFKGLPPDDYLVTVKVACKNGGEASKTEKVTVNAEYNELIAYIASSRPTLQCNAAGLIAIVVRNGVAPYKIVMTDAPSAYKGNKVFDLQTPATYEVADLPEGSYKFTVTDACSYSIPMDPVTIGKSVSDFPVDAFAADAYPSACKTACVSYNSSSDGNHYWNYYRSSSYEIAYSLDGTKKWIPVDDAAQQCIELPDFYQNLYNKNQKLKVYLRLKGSNCEQYMGDINFVQPPEPDIWFDKEKCGNYGWYFYLYNIGMMCLPYKYEVRDDANKIVASLSGQNAPDFSIPDLLYNKNYVITITDAQNREFSYTTNQQIRDMELINEWSVKRCADYDYVLNFAFICLPCKWEIYDGGGKLLSSGNETNETNETDVVFKNLEYNKNYTLKITDANNRTESRNVFDNAPPTAGFNHYIHEYKCDTYDIMLLPFDFCLPYEIEVGAGTKIPGSNELSDQPVTGLKYNTDYRIKVSDGKNEEFIIINNPRPKLYIPDAELWYENSGCADYTLRFKPTNLFCFPYKWEIFDKNNTLAESKTNINDDEDQRVKLKTNIDYTLKITAADGETYTIANYIFQGGASYNPGFSFYFHNDYCSRKGCMQLSGDFAADTHVRFIDGPQKPIHTDVVISESTNLFYPFSENFGNCDYVSIKSGTYAFEITDKCGNTNVYTFDCRYLVDAQNFGYTLQPTCSGITRLYPSGQLFDEYDNAVTTCYYLENTDGSYRYYSYYSAGYPSFFELYKSGTYKLTIKQASNDDCVCEEIIINYEQKTFSLDGRSSYVCEPSGSGKIRVRAKNGVAPYVYQLLNKDGTPVAGVPVNNTGNFDFGAYGEQYKVKITDDCGKSFDIDVYIVTLENIPLISGMPELCAGDKIELNGLLIGAQSYEWTTPKGIVNTQNLTISDIDASDAGRYVLKVQPAGCNLLMTDNMDIDIYTVPKPFDSDIVNLCINDSPRNLSIAPAAEHTVNWYDENGTKLNAAPTVYADNIDEFHYIVEQTHNTKGCTLRQNITARVSDLPNGKADASGWSCENGNPQITVTGVEKNYIYTVFGNSALTDKIMSFDGTAAAMSVVMPTTISENTTFYLHTANAAGCASKSPVSDFEATVNKLTLEPDVLPAFAVEMPYSVQLTTNAVPYFTYTGSLVTGIDLRADGLISGTAPASAVNETGTFVAAAYDNHGCPAEREYLLRSCEPAPETNDISYCQQTQAVPLQALSAKDLPLNWYDENMTKLPSAPTPDTDVAGTQVFYVSQTSEVLNCESLASKITVTINPAPEIEFTAEAKPVCHGERASIVLNNLNSLYAYFIYKTSASTNNPLASHSGTESATLDLYENLENNTDYFIRVMDPEACVSLNSLQIGIEVVKLYLLPETLPSYNTKGEYDRTFASNAEQPIFSLTGMLPDGLKFSSNGHLYGIVEAANKNTEFNVTVTDVNGCTADRDYLLTGNLFISKIFTPNGDGINDIFMPQYKLVVFDRLGVEIYSGENGWDGTRNGKPVPPDIYFYKLFNVDKITGELKKIETGYVGLER